MIHLRAAEEKQNGFWWYIFTNKVTLLSASYSTCVAYTKIVIPLSVGESGGYLPSLHTYNQGNVNGWYVMGSIFQTGFYEGGRKSKTLPA